MTTQTYSTLRDLQALDERMDSIRSRIAEFQPLLEEVEEPALRLESQVEGTEERLQEVELEERRLELSADEKRERKAKLEDRLKSVRNVREEAAVQAELDMVRRAVEADEQEALSLLDQVRKLEERLEEERERLEEAREEIEPRRQELLKEREELETELEELEEKRARFMEEIDDSERKVYETIRSGGRDVAVASLTADGACGNCFGMIPLQLRNEVRHGGEMIRCEACGVILAPADNEGDDGDEG